MCCKLQAQLFCENVVYFDQKMAATQERWSTIWEDMNFCHFWCNGLVRGCSLGLQADVNTLGRIGDDDALSSG